MWPREFGIPDGSEDNLEAMATKNVAETPAGFQRESVILSWNMEVPWQFVIVFRIVMMILGILFVRVIVTSLAMCDVYE